MIALPFRFLCNGCSNKKILIIFRGLNDEKNNDSQRAVRIAEC